jgi:hypothetical protein
MRFPGRRAREIPTRGPAAFVELRTLWLSSDPSKLGLHPTPVLPHVWGAALELRVGRVGEAVVFLAAVAEGSVSMYLSTGGGIIGGGQHAAIRAAGQRFLEAVESSLSQFEPHESFAPVRPERASFIAQTYQGKLGADVLEADAQLGTNPLSGCYGAAQDLITQLRLANPKW